MMIIKWEKDEYEEMLFDLYGYLADNTKIHLAMLYWDNMRKCWILSYELPRLKSKSRKYNNYGIDELNDVLFNAILDIQTDLNGIICMCRNYKEAFSNCIINYIQGMDYYNEN